MEGNKDLFESLLERVTDYVKTTIELVKLRILDKASEGISILISHTIVFVFVVTGLFFLTTGLALWLGEILGNVYFGFLIAGAFYGLMALVIHLFLHKRIKRFFCDYMIKQVLK